MKPPSEFEQQAAPVQRGFFREMWDFMRNNKKWWLTPIIVILLLAGALVILGGSGLAPFIYTIF